MAKLDRDGVQISYDVQGTGPAVLLTHGYASSARMWEGQVAAFRDRYRVITWDMRGHADSDSPGDPARYSEAATVADMAAILDACGVQRAVIGGLSLGGYMSLAFHLAHPGRTRALTLFDTGPGYRNPKSRDGWNETARQRARAFEERGLAALGASAEVRVSVHRSADGLALAARGMLAQVDGRVIESLEHIRVPTLVLVGENDTPFLQATELHGCEDPWSEARGRCQRGARLEYRPASGLQCRRRGLSGLAARRLKGCVLFVLPSRLVFLVTAPR